MRTGLVAKKLGMSRFFASDGTNVPVTLLKVDSCKVIDQKIQEKHGYNALRLSFSASKKNKVNKPTLGYFKKIKSEASSKTKEFRVSKKGMINIGSTISVDHFIEGQMVDVSGYTIGKGFAGGMKRHNFSGNRATHGVSISHRSHGSTGQCQDPGKVFKGKKMAGRLGNVMCTVQNLKVVQTDNDQGIIVVKGAIPGPKGLFVSISDSTKFKNKNLPYPTIQSKNNESNDTVENGQLQNKFDGKNENTEPTGSDKKSNNAESVEINQESEKNLEASSDDKAKQNITPKSEGKDETSS